MDSSALRFLTAQALEAKRKDEEEEERKKQVQEAKEFNKQLLERLTAAGRRGLEKRLDTRGASSKRKKKKRRRKKLPKASSSRLRRGVCSSVSECCLKSTRFGSWEMTSGSSPNTVLYWFGSGYSTCVSCRCFWILFHTFLCEGGHWFLDQMDGHSCRVSLAALVADSGIDMCMVVLLVCSSSCVPFCSLQTHDARRHGWYEPEGIFYVVSCSMSLLCGRADSQVLLWRRPWRSHSCSLLRIRRLLLLTAENCGFSADAVHLGRCLPVATQSLIPMVLVTIETLHLLFDMVVNAAIMQVVLVPGFQLPCRVAEASPWSRLSVGPLRFLVARRQGGRWPCWQVVQILLVNLHVALCFCCCQAIMRCIMAVMDQKDFLLAVACARLVFAFGVCYTPWFDSGYMFAISLRGFLVAFFASLREGRTLRILRSILVFLAANCGVSSTSLS